MTQKGSLFLIEEEKIKRRIKELASEIKKDYEGKKPLFIGILKGAFIFLADLVREVDMDLEIDFLAVSSYGKFTETTGEVEILKDLQIPVKGRHVIIVEDIIDTGLTLKYIKDMLLSRNPASLKVCALLDKKERRKVDIEADYVGFVVPDKFLVGYGLDVAEKYRNLPYIREIES